MFYELGGKDYQADLLKNISSIGLLLKFIPAINFQHDLKRST